MAMEIEQICRTCLALSGPLLSIFEGAGTGGGGCIADMLRDFTKIKPMPADQLPEKVCLSCISEINRCYTFKLKCENSNRTLRQMLPEAVPEQMDTPEPQQPVEQATKSVQTTAQRKARQTTVETQTTEVLKQEQQSAHQMHQYTQTATLSNTDRATSPFHMNHKKSTAHLVNAAEPPQHHDTRLCGETQKRRIALLDAVTIKRRRSSSFDAEVEVTGGPEIIMELQTNDECAPTATAYSGEHAEANENTTYYELSNTRFQYDNVDDADTVEAEEEETDAESEYTQYFYEEDNDGEPAAESQSPQELSDYNFTIYKKENGETEIIAKGPATRVAIPTAKSRNKKEVQCSKCSMTFVNGKSLQRHMVRRHGEQPHPEAERRPTSQAEFVVKEITMGEKEKTLEINAEANAATAEDALLTPFESGTPQPILTTTTPAKLTFFCDRCGAGFALHKSLRYHRNLNTCTALTYSCDKCERVFVSVENLAEHKATHDDIACTECNSTFRTKEELTQHMIVKHNRNIKNQCEVCKKVFTMLSALKDHMRVHTGEKPFLCPLCGKAFSQNANLKQHIMRHSKEKKFKCDECPTSFVTKGELSSHKRTHTGEQPFQCEYCQASFTTSSSLVKHKRKHTGERPYACDLCPNRFTALSVLKNHRRTHTGEKPYKCMYCSKSFTQKHDCLIHHRTHTGERNYGCGACGEKFTHLGTLRTHKKTHNKGRTTEDDGDGTNIPSQKRRSTSARHAKSITTRDNRTTTALITILDVDDEEEEDGIDLEPATIVTVRESDESEGHDSTVSGRNQQLIQLAIDDI